jgi:cell division protein ZapA
MGKSYTIKCQSEKAQELHQAALTLNQKLLEIKGQNHGITLEKIALNAALNLTHELASATKNDNFSKTEIETRINRMQKLVTDTLTEQQDFI